MYLYIFYHKKPYNLDKYIHHYVSGAFLHFKALH